MLASVCLDKIEREKYIKTSVYIASLSFCVSDALMSRNWRCHSYEDEENHVFEAVTYRLDPCEGVSLLTHREAANIFSRIWSLWICIWAIPGLYLGWDT
jgi:hypothetical protein